MAISSTTLARCGSSSDSSAPDWPYFANLNLDPSSFELGLMNAARYPFNKSAGGSVPSNFASCGFLSNRSRWLGAPAMNTKITRFARGANWGGLGANGLSDDGLFSAASPSQSPRPTAPRPTPQRSTN